MIGRVPRLTVRTRRLPEMNWEGSGLTENILRLTVSSVTLAKTVLRPAVMVPRLAGRAMTRTGRVLSLTGRDLRLTGRAVRLTGRVPKLAEMVELQ